MYTSLGQQNLIKYYFKFGCNITLNPIVCCESMNWLLYFGGLFNGKCCVLSYDKSIHLQNSQIIGSFTSFVCWRDEMDLLQERDICSINIKINWNDSLAKIHFSQWSSFRGRRIPVVTRVWCTSGYVYWSISFWPLSQTIY